MNPSGLAFRIGHNHPNDWAEIVERAAANQTPVRVIERAQTASLQPVTNGATYVCSPEAKALDVKIDAVEPASIWAASFPQLKTSGTVVLSSQLAGDVPAPESMASLLLHLASQNIAIDIVADTSIDFDPFVETVPLADTGTAFNEFIGQTLSRVASGPLLAGLLLANAEDDASHRVSQAFEGRPDYDYWHGLMHRREPDYGNASYWFRRVGDHPAYNTLIDAVQDRLAMFELSDQFSIGDSWDPFAMIDFCRRSASDDSMETTARLVQQVEYAHLIEYHSTGT